MSGSAILKVNKMEITDDVVYSIVLLSTVPAGLLVKQISSPELKKAVCTIIGIAIAFLTIGGHILHPTFVTLSSILIIKLAGPR